MRNLDHIHHERQCKTRKERKWLRTHFSVDGRINQDISAASESAFVRIEDIKKKVLLLLEEEN
jgi:hypothetical protein